MYRLSINSEDKEILHLIFKMGLRNLLIKALKNNGLHSMFSCVALKGILFIQLALWLAPILLKQRSCSLTIGVSATVDLYTSEVAASQNGAINNLAFPSVLGGSAVFDTIYSTYNVTGIMAIGAALLAAGGN